MGKSFRRDTSILRTIVLLSIAAIAAWPAFPAEECMIRLAGTPEKIGALWGKTNKGIIVEEIENGYLRRAAEAGISRETLIKRSAAYVRIAQEIAPHWLEEGRAVASAAKIEEDLYIAFADGNSRGRFLHEDPLAPDDAIVECTSYAVSRDHARDGAILFHKTRDNTDKPQVAVLVDSSRKGVNKFLAITNGDAIRCSMMVNEKGLAGSGDYPADKKKDSSTLHLEPADPQYRGVMAGTILRHIAERASTAGEALAIVEDFVKKGYYAGGDVNGSHWLFVDRAGTIIEVCNNSRHVVSMVHTQKAYFSRFNKCEAAQRLREADAVDFGLFHSIAREQPLLTKQSISGMTVEIDPDYPELLTCAWISLPVRAVAFPVFMGQRRAPVCLADGTAYALGKESPSQTPRWKDMEQAMHTERETLKNELAASIAAGKSTKAQVKRMERWSQDQATALVRALQQPE